MEIKAYTSHEDFSSNLYLLINNNEIILIDPGFFDEKIIEEINNNGKLVAILLTHGHADHIRGLAKYLTYYDVPVYCHKNEEIYLRNDDYNCGYEIYGYSCSYKGDLNFLNTEKQKISTFEFETFLFPGHTPGSLAYYFPKDNAIFVGDFIIGYSVGRCDLKGGNEKELMKSLTKFKQLNFPPETILYSGHDSPNYLKILYKRNPFISK